jgi:hypothetical protein
MRPYKMQPCDNFVCISACYGRSVPSKNRPVNEAFLVRINASSCGRSFPCTICGPLTYDNIVPVTGQIHNKNFKFVHVIYLPPTNCNGYEYIVLITFPPQKN